jgi:nucleotide-binding universal stress UspA family protein
VAVVVGYDHHPASRAALLFAGQLAGALSVHLYVVHVVDVSDSPLVGASCHPNRATRRYLDSERQHVATALAAAPAEWTYHLMNGDPVAVLLAAARDRDVSMIVVGRPEHGLGAAVGHLVTAAVTRALIRRSDCPVVVVPEPVNGAR